MVTFDGLFGLPRKRAAGVQRHEPLLGNLFLLEQQDVHKFVVSYTADTKKDEGVFIRLYIPTEFLKTLFYHYSI